VLSLDVYDVQGRPTPVQCNRVVSWGTVIIRMAGSSFEAYMFQMRDNVVQG